MSDGPIKVRVAVQGGEKWINVNDFREALKNDEFIHELIAVMKVGHDRKADPLDVVRCTVGAALFKLSGDEDEHSARGN